MRVVDVACGLGNHFQEFIRRGVKHFPDDPRIMVIEPKECLGLDTKEGFRADLEDRGYCFNCCPEVREEDIPETDYILCWGHLDCLPGSQEVKSFLEVMLSKAWKGIWINLLSHEQDIRESLYGHGLRFAWDDATISPSARSLSSLIQMVNDYRKEKGRNSISVKLAAGQRVYTTDDPALIPQGSPSGTLFYTSELGPRPDLKFDPPLVAAWDFIIHV